MAAENPVASPATADPFEGGAVAQPGRVGRFFREARRYPLFPIALLLIVMVIPAVAADWIAPHDPKLGSLSSKLQPPAWMEGGSAEHLLGTDRVGRDILSRIMHGARVSVVIAAIAICIAGVLGTSLGIAAGYWGGWVDAVVMRLVDISLSIPIILLALVIVAATKPSMATVITVLVLLMWSRYARLVRGETLAVRVQDFIARARVSGASPPADHVPPRVPQRVQQRHRAGHAERRLRYHPGSDAELPGRRHPAATAGVGPDGRRTDGCSSRRLRAGGFPSSPAWPSCWWCSA